MIPVCNALGVTDKCPADRTNVTLRPGDGYQVQFVNNTNITQVFAASPTFTVKPPGSECSHPPQSTCCAHEYPPRSLPCPDRDRVLECRQWQRHLSERIWIVQHR